MSISLQKGQKVSLTKESKEGLNKVVVGLGWDEVQPAGKGGLFGALFSAPAQAIDCDASAILLQNGKLVDGKDVIYFGNLQHRSGAVKHMGDNLTGAGDGDDEQIFVDLQNVPYDIGTIVFAVNIYDALNRNQHFGMIRNAFIRVVDYERNIELCRFNLNENYNNMTALVAGALMRTDNGWEFITDGNAARVESLVNVVAAFAD